MGTIDGTMTDTEPKLDYRLVRAMRRGPDVLPGDIAQLRGYLRMIEMLLAEKASELEPSWDRAAPPRPRSRRC